MKNDLQSFFGYLLNPLIFCILPDEDITIYFPELKNSSEEENPEIQVYLNRNGSYSVGYGKSIIIEFHIHRLLELFKYFKEHEGHLIFDPHDLLKKTILSII